MLCIPQKYQDTLGKKTSVIASSTAGGKAWFNTGLLDIEASARQTVLMCSMADFNSKESASSARAPDVRFM